MKKLKYSSRTVTEEQLYKYNTYNLKQWIKKYLGELKRVTTFYRKKKEKFKKGILWSY